MSNRIPEVVDEEDPNYADKTWEIVEHAINEIYDPNSSGFSDDEYFRLSEHVDIMVNLNFGESKSNRSMSPAAAELPKELLEEILVRLPSRALVRFKTVSKQWLELTTNNRFLVRQHSMIKVRNLASVLVPRRSILSYDKILFDFVSISPDHAVTNINLPGVEEGSLVLVSVGFGIYCFSKHDNGILHLWNPTTRECIDVPPPPPDYNVCCHSFCFGEVDYDDGVFSYNVGHIFKNSVVQMWSVELYSSKTKSWTITPNVFDGKILRLFSRGCVNLNGKAHWATRCNVRGDRVTKIIAFDYYNRASRQISVQLVPEVGLYNWWNGFITLWDETFICLAMSWEKDEKLFIDIWVMREYMVGASLIKELTIGPFSKYDRVLGFSGKLRILFLRKGHSQHNSLIFYDLKSSSMKELSLPSGRYKVYSMITEHVESLVSLLK